MGAAGLAFEELLGRLSSAEQASARAWLGAAFDRAGQARPRTARRAALGASRPALQNYSTTDPPILGVGSVSPRYTFIFTTSNLLSILPYFFYHPSFIRKKSSGVAE